MASQGRGRGAALDIGSGSAHKARMHILVLGGTTEASGLVARLAGRPGLTVTLSLAGRTAAPSPAPVPTRVGGFGGAEGLARWIAAHGVGLVVDATHPFAAVISGNAAVACARSGMPLLALRRPPWRAVAGDRWIEVGTMAEAVAALGAAPRRVFLTVGRLELPAFAAAPQHAYVARTIEPIGDALSGPDVVAIRARGPFDEAAERALMERHGVEMVVTKNAGGTATAGKIAAARALGLPVVMVARPTKPEGPAVESVEAALAWIEAHGPPP
jgi:precorrin-6A/cobalt-precorrin-6A reductase